MYLTQNPKTAYRTIHGEAVIVDLSTNMLYSLNPVATLIWEMSDGKTTVEDIVKKMEEEYEVERNVAEKDCRKFIQDFVIKRLLLESEKSKEG